MKSFSLFRNLSLIVLLLSACTTTPPKPTGDRISSVSWVNRSPTSYRYVQTSLCSSESVLTLEGLGAYSEKVMPFDLALTQNCKVTLTSVVGKQTLPRQSNWIKGPKSVSPSREYHLRIQVFPTTPPILRLEPIEKARQRLKDAGRPIPGS